MFKFAVDSSMSLRNTCAYLQPVNCHVPSMGTTVLV